MDTGLDTLAAALYVKADDLLTESPELAPWRPVVGARPLLSDAELVTLAVMQALQGAHQVQQSLEVPRMLGAVPVLGSSGQVRTLRGLAGWAAFNRGGIHHPHVAGPDGGIGGQGTDAVPDQAGGGAQPLVTAGCCGR